MVRQRKTYVIGADQRKLVQASRYPEVCSIHDPSVTGQLENASQIQAKKEESK